METQILNVLSPTILLAIGVLLIATEAILFSFILIWFGVATIIVALISSFLVFDDGLWQIACISILAMILLFTLRSKMMVKFLKSKDKEVNDTFLNEKGEGIIENGKVNYKATYWDIDSEEKDFKEGEKVIVLEALKNKAKIKRY